MTISSCSCSCSIVLGGEGTGGECLSAFAALLIHVCELTSIHDDILSSYSPKLCGGPKTGDHSVKTLRTQDTSDRRHFGTSADLSVELSGQMGNTAETLQH